MSTEERDESQLRPKKVIPSIRRENTDQEGERRPYNQGYNKPEGSYERRPYRSYGEKALHLLIISLCNSRVFLILFASP